MSGLSALKLVQAKREKASSPQHARRQKLSTKLAEQVQLAKAQQAGTEFSPVRVRSVKDEATGQSRQVEVPKQLKPWWWTDAQQPVPAGERHPQLQAPPVLGHLTAREPAQRAGAAADGAHEVPPNRRHRDGHQQQHQRLNPSISQGQCALAEPAPQWPTDIINLES